MTSFAALSAPETDTLVILVASQDEGAMDSFGGDKSLEQGRRKLDGLAARTSGDDMANCAPVKIQASLRGDVKLKFEVVHAPVTK